MNTSIAARISISAALAYHVILFALIPMRPDLDPYWHTISEYAIGPYGWIMVMGFLLSALSYGSLFVAIRAQVPGIMGKVGLFILAVCTLGTVLVGVFITDPMPEVGGPQNADIVLSTAGTIHMIGGGSALALLPFGALLINLSIALKNKSWVKSKRALLLTAALPLLGLAAFIIHMNIYIIPLGDYAYGPDVPLGWPPRMLFLSYLVWIVTLSVQATRRIISQD